MNDHYEMSTDQRVYVWVKSGLLDLMLGLAILGFGLGIVSEAVWMGGVLLPILLPSILAAHKSYAQRLDDIVPDLSGSGQKLTWLGLTLVGLLSLAAGVAFFMVMRIDQPTVASIRAWLSNHMTLAMSLLWVLMFASTGGVVRQTRFGIYAGAALTIGLAAQHLDWAFWMAPILTGGLVSLAGIAVTINFLQAHPKTARER